MALPNWKGRPYRPVGGTGYIRVYKPDINELMKPLSQKSGLGSAILTGNIINPKNQPQTSSPSVTVTPTPSITPSLTPTITPPNTPTVTPTPSSTPPIPAHRVWNTNNRKWENDGDNWDQP